MIEQMLLYSHPGGLSVLLYLPQLCQSVLLSCGQQPVLRLGAALLTGKALLKLLIASSSVVVL